jgi:TPR repeat protein
MREVATILLLLLLCGALPARAVERVVVEHFPWWLAADAALARGDCGAALALLVPNAFEGHYGAVGRLGDLAETGACPGHDLPPPLALYDGLIGAGVAIAKARLGQLHLLGEGVPQDEVRARRLFQEVLVESIVGAFPEARRGNFRETMGRHAIPPLLAEELAWLERIESGPPEGQYELAVRLMEGDGLPRHAEAARMIMHLPSLAGLPQARYRLGRWEIEGRFARADPHTGLFLVADAATHGHPQAIEEMGRRFAYGLLIEPNPLRALALLLKAERLGADVGDAVAHVTGQLTEVEREVAAEMASREEMLVTFSWKEESPTDTPARSSAAGAR